MAKISTLYMLLVILCSKGLCEDGPKYLTSLLRSNWGYTPFLLEASEFLWDYNENIFWDFLNSSKALYITTDSDQDVYEVVTDLAEQLLPASVHNLFLFSLSLHTYSPAVQLFQQLSSEALSKWPTKERDGCNDQGVFMEVHGHYLCSIGNLQKLIADIDLDRDSPPHIYKFDHLFSSLDWDDVPLVILYGELGTAQFAVTHSALLEMALGKHVRYVFRHHYKGRTTQHSLLSGYGVQLSVKNTEYKAVDDTEVKGGSGGVLASTEEASEVSGFNFLTLRARYPSMTTDLKDFEVHLLQGARELPELRLWQLQDLGYQAVQRIAGAGTEFGLKVLKDISQNLPAQAKSLYKVQVDKALRKEIQNNQKALASTGISPGDCVLFLNGIVIQKDSMDIYQLFEVLFSESQLLDSLNGLGIESSAHASLLAMSVHRSGSSQVVLDVRSKAVVFINDLEKDRMYRSWAKSLKEFLRPTYPGMLRQIARNVFNIVFLLDPWSSSGVEMLEYVKLFLEHVVPARLGLVLLPDPNQEAAVAVCQGFAFLSAKLSPREGLRWLIKAQELLLAVESNVTSDDVHQLFEQVFSKALDKVSVTQVFSEEWDSYRKEAAAFFASKGFVSIPQVLVNGVQLDLEEDLESALVTRMQYQMFEIQQAIFNSQLKDKDNVYDYWMEKPNVLSRINVHVLASSEVFDLSYPVLEDTSLEETSNPLLISASVAKDLEYLRQPQGEFIVKELSVWMVVDVGTSQGRQMTLEAIKYSMETELVRVGIVHNHCGSLLSRAIQAALLSQSAVSSSLLKFLLDILSLTELVEVEDIIDVANNSSLDGEKLVQLLFSARVNSSLAQHTLFSRTVLNFKAGQNALLSNGKLIGPLGDHEVFSEADWSMLDNMESETYAAKLAAVVGGLSVNEVSPDEDTSSYRSDLVMKLASLLRSQPKKSRLSQVPSLSGHHSVLHMPPLDPDLYLSIVAVLDPLSPDTQKFAPVLQVLHTALSLDLTVYFNPVAKLSQMPITSFYRYVLQPELSFSENGSVEENTVAIFSDLPTSPLFTLSLDVPHSWLVEPVFSPYDLDNIHLAQVPDRNIHAEFVLEHILVEGQCFDVRSEQPTPGLEFVLGSDAQPDKFDTIVMANLGYFQLKAGPGAWLLRLREGRSRDIYFIQSYSGEDGKGKLQELEGSNEVFISVRSYAGAGVVVKVAKKEGMENTELLISDDVDKPADDESTDDGLWTTLSNLLQSNEQEDAGSKKIEVAVNETINIFSIASGHLYERFLRIMMLSVIKHTQNPVKFWFLKNYLSPTFKESIPHMASHYGFDYELVEYKWPRWLHQQSQKQRIIWGYKILFLDVLFPLNIKKIIFVDADQIVRTDLKELLEMPLDGAPYAYTPFCDSRPDMEGFRFWEKGYWKSHLGNRRYHISALYVVDLVTFRRLAAGDRLRGQYQALSQDPNSLSNLDQDLPNNMIHSVPIKSLPQEWLWCETWCSQESKAQAKTIDLCNNPLTKEPKLQSAMRIVPEWTDYDKEIKSLWTAESLDSQTLQHNRIHSHTEL